MEHKADGSLAFFVKIAITIDNNPTEGKLCRLTIGRQRRLFVGSSRGGQVAATMYSLVSSAVRHQLDAWEYVDDCLRQRPARMMHRCFRMFGKSRIRSQSASTVILNRSHDA